MNKESRKKLPELSDHINCILDKMGEIEKGNPNIIGNYSIDFFHFQIQEKNGFVIPFRTKSEMLARITECNLRFREETKEYNYSAHLR
jgi:hypothetical protein